VGPGRGRTSPERWKAGKGDGRRLKTERRGNISKILIGKEEPEGVTRKKRRGLMGGVVSRGVGAGFARRGQRRCKAKSGEGLR